MITNTRWLGLLHCTEENRPHLWPLIGWTVRLRVEADRVMFGGNTYAGVITKPFQYSRFNGVTGTPEEKYAKVRDALRPNGERFYPEVQIALAEACAAWILGTPREGCPLPDNSFFFWSPAGMDPPYSRPRGWDWTKVEAFCCPGVSPFRLLHAREIR